VIRNLLQGDHIVELRREIERLARLQSSAWDGRRR
jgi:hypothetical protein